MPGVTSRSIALLLLLVLPAAADAGEVELLAELDGVDSVSGSSVGFGGVESRFYQIYRGLAALDSADLPERLIAHPLPVRRCMGLVLLVERDGEKAAPVLIRRLADGAAVTVNPGGCVYEWGSVGRVARGLLGNRNWMTQMSGSEWTPLLGPEELLEIDVGLLGRDDAVRIHDEIAGDVLDAIEEGRLPLDLDALGERYPSIPAVRLVKAIGRLRNDRYFSDADAQLDITRWATQLASNRELSDGVRLAAASALCHHIWREDPDFDRPLPVATLAGLPEEATRIILRDFENERDRARLGRESGVLERGHVLAVREIVGQFLDLRDSPEAEYPDRHRAALLRVAERLEEWQPEWNSFGDGLYELAAGLSEYRDVMRRVLDREEQLRLLRRLRLLMLRDR